MIKNDRQLTIAKRKREELLGSAQDLADEDKSVYLELARDLQQEIEEYVSIRDGEVQTFELKSVDDIARSVARARIARGLTQAQLADALNTSEQNVQRDEARDYEQVGVAKLATLLDVLGYTLTGTLTPKELPTAGAPQIWIYPHVRLRGNSVQHAQPGMIGVRTSALSPGTLTCAMSGVRLVGDAHLAYSHTSSMRIRGANNEA
jgi:ribosome-binding protein aMBF1 (putative translation factor)